MKYNNKEYNFIVGVPCSKFKNIINYDEAIIATREDEAVAMAVGAYFAGKTPLVFMQNSGLMNALDVITSLLIPYDISIDFLISLRCKPEHHSYAGKITKDLIKLMGYDKVTFLEENEK